MREVTWVLYVQRFKKWEKLVDEFLNVLGETREQLKDVGIDGVEGNSRQETSKIS